MKQNVFKVAKLALVLAVGFLAACAQNVEDYVKGAEPSTGSSPIAIDQVAGPMSLKVSPGKMNGTSPNIALKGTVSPTNQMFSLGPNRAVSLTLSRGRVSPQ